MSKDFCEKSLLTRFNYEATKSAKKKATAMPAVLLVLLYIFFALFVASWLKSVIEFSQPPFCLPDTLALCCARSPIRSLTIDHCSLFTNVRSTQTNYPRH